MKQQSTAVVSRAKLAFELIVKNHINCTHHMTLDFLID